MKGIIIKLKESTIVTFLRRQNNDKFNGGQGKLMVGKGLHDIGKMYSLPSAITHIYTVNESAR